MADRRFSGKASDETTPAPGDVAPGPDSQVARERKSGLQPARPLSLQNGDSSSQQASATNTAATPDEEASPSTSSAEVPSVRTPTTSRMDTGKGSANKAANFLQNVRLTAAVVFAGLSILCGRFCSVRPGPAMTFSKCQHNERTFETGLTCTNAHSAKSVWNSGHLVIVPIEICITTCACYQYIRNVSLQDLDGNCIDAFLRCSFVPLQVIREGPKMEEGLSMEQFTLRKEAEMKARGAEVITIDGQASADGTESGYRPKVATWGVFPRPQNISEAFGGGRNIRPGQVRAYLDSSSYDSFWHQKHGWKGPTIHLTRTSQIRLMLGGIAASNHTVQRCADRPLHVNLVELRCMRGKSLMVLGILLSELFAFLSSPL